MLPLAPMAPPMVPVATPPLYAVPPTAPYSCPQPPGMPPMTVPVLPPTPAVGAAPVLPAVSAFPPAPGTTSPHQQSFRYDCGNLQSSQQHQPNNASGFAVPGTPHPFPTPGPLMPHPHAGIHVPLTPASAFSNSASNTPLTLRSQSQQQPPPSTSAVFNTPMLAAVAASPQSQQPSAGGPRSSQQTTPCGPVACESRVAAQLMALKRGIDIERYKTQLCKTFRKTGQCPYFDRCMFAHGARELRTAEQNVELVASLEAKSLESPIVHLKPTPTQRRRQRRERRARAMDEAAPHAATSEALRRTAHDGDSASDSFSDDDSVMDEMPPPAVSAADFPVPDA